MGLKNVLETLSEGVQDLSSLHVQTYSGFVTFSPDANANTRRKQLQDFISKPNADSTIELIVETLINFDGDAYNFVSTNATDALKQAHKDALDSGIKTRQGIYALVEGWIK